MEGFSFRNPSFKRVGRVLHGQDHGRELSVKSHGELGDCREFILKLRLCSEVFEVIDVLLEPVVRGSIFIFSWSLDEVG